MQESLEMSVMEREQPLIEMDGVDIVNDGNLILSGVSLKVH